MGFSLRKVKNNTVSHSQVSNQDCFKNSIWIGGAAHGEVNYYISPCYQTGLQGLSCHPEAVGPGTQRGSTEQGLCSQLS